MERSQFLKTLEGFTPDLPPKEILKAIDYNSLNNDQWGDDEMPQDELRAEVSEALLTKLNTKHLELIRYLLRQEINYSRRKMSMRETLRELTFMLYMTGEMSDIPLLYEAKLDTSFDAGCGLNIELIFWKDKEEVKRFFSKNKHPKYDIVETITDYEQYDFQSHEAFVSWMKSYYELN
ncbi:MAG: hypothetical protein AB8F95_03365 [Bacteroidia bacterium]